MHSTRETQPVGELVCESRRSTKMIVYHVVDGKWVTSRLQTA